MSPQPGLLGTPAVSPMYTVGMAPMMGMNMNMGLGMMGMGMTPMPPLPPAPPMSMMVPAPLGPPPPKFDMKSDGSQVTTVYVGKIAPGVEDDFIRKFTGGSSTLHCLILTERSNVVLFPRGGVLPTQPLGSLKDLVLCDYTNPNGVITALKLLNGLEVNGSALLVRCAQIVIILIHPG